MITLEANTTIYGKAEIISCITYTISGVELQGSREEYKILTQGQLSNNLSLLYTVPSLKSTLIKSILLSNTSDSLIKGIKFYIGGISNSNVIVNLSIPPNGSAKFDSTGWKVYDFLGIEFTSSDLITLYEEVNSTISYIGKALPGTSTSSSLWKIAKIDTTSGISIKWADGNSNFDNIWDNRASLTYS